VPVLVVLLIADTTASNVAAAALFAIGAWTDLLDGYLARRWGITSRTGAWLDPLADKLLVGAPIVTLAVLDRFPVWAAVVILAREVLVTGLRIFLGRRGQTMPASRVAKWKTFTQLAAIFLYILPLTGWPANIRMPFLIIAVALTVYTGIDYVVAAVRWVRSSRSSHSSERPSTPVVDGNEP
jgi:CDP-diacylglycerol---glycerol-3-phosphate 3-phosphatidyltransferase